MKNLNFQYLKILPKNNTSRYLFINYEHDATLLNWIKEKKRLEIDNFFLITIDSHIDLTFFDDITLDNLKECRKSFETLTIERLKKLIHSKFHPHSVSFITAAMELGIVNDVLIISPNHNRFHWRDNEEISYKRLRCLKTKFETYEDSFGIEHKVHFIPYMHHLSEGNKGILTDIVDKSKIKLRTQILNSKLIIDIDLDYCTYSRDFRIFVIRSQNFNWEFESEKFMDLLINNADIISISLEPTYCGGKSNCEMISELFGHLFQYCEILNNPDALRLAVNQILYEY